MGYITVILSSSLDLAGQTHEVTAKRNASVAMRRIASKDEFESKCQFVATNCGRFPEMPFKVTRAATERPAQFAVGAEAPVVPVAASGQATARTLVIHLYDYVHVPAVHWRLAKARVDEVYGNI